jgi:hypothetical protein
LTLWLKFHGTVDTESRFWATRECQGPLGLVLQSWISWSQNLD